jgi:hypothetical protein
MLPSRTSKIFGKSNCLIVQKLSGIPASENNAAPTFPDASQRRHFPEAIHVLADFAARFATTHCFA